MKKMLVLAAFVSLFCLLLSCGSTSELVSRHKEYSCISLKNLSIFVKNCQDRRATIPRNVRFLQGFSRIDGYCADPADSDIILFGKCDRSRPGYDVYDLFACYQCIYGQQGFPFCSLDPLPENIMKFRRLQFPAAADPDEIKMAMADAMGDQKVVIGGVPRNSRLAATMIEADYYMKKISLGLVKVPGIKSYLDLLMERSQTGAAIPRRNNVRFWFHIKNADPACYPRFDYNQGIVRISQCPVVILTERQVADDNGVLSDSRQKDPVADAFAKEMTVHFERLAEKIRSFRMLENYYRLSAVVLSIKNRLHRSYPEETICNTFDNAEIKPWKTLPDFLPCLTNAYSYQIERYRNAGTREIQTSLFTVCGGVSMQMGIDGANYSRNAALETYNYEVVSQRPSRSALFWEAVL